MAMIMKLERTSEEVKIRARHVVICDNYPKKHRKGGSRAGDEVDESCGAKEDRKYPYLLGERKVERPDEIWAADITYIPMRGGCVLGSSYGLVFEEGVELEGVEHYGQRIARGR